MKTFTVSLFYPFFILFFFIYLFILTMLILCALQAKNWLGRREDNDKTTEGGTSSDSSCHGFDPLLGLRNSFYILISVLFLS